MAEILESKEVFEEVLGEDVFGNADPDLSPKATAESGRKSTPGTPERKLRAEPQVTEFKRKELEGDMKPEFLLTPNPHRFVLFPIQNKDVRFLSTLEGLCHV